MAYLRPALLGKLDAVVGDKLVDIAVLVPFRLRVADQYNHLRMSVSASRRPSHDSSTYAGLPHVGGSVS